MFVKILDADTKDFSFQLDIATYRSNSSNRGATTTKQTLSLLSHPNCRRREGAAGRLLNFFQAGPLSFPRIPRNELESGKLFYAKGESCEGPPPGSCGDCAGCRSCNPILWPGRHAGTGYSQPRGRRRSHPCKGRGSFHACGPIHSASCNHHGSRGCPESIERHRATWSSAGASRRCHRC